MYHMFTTYFVQKKENISAKENNRKINRTPFTLLVLHIRRQCKIYLQK